MAEVSPPLTITGGALWSTFYTDLTMVAQFDDYALAAQSSTEPVLALANGDYVLTFRRLTLGTPTTRLRRTTPPSAPSW